VALARRGLTPQRPRLPLRRRLCRSRRGPRHLSTRRSTASEKLAGTRTLRRHSARRRLPARPRAGRGGPLLVGLSRSAPAAAPWNRSGSQRARARRARTARCTGSMAAGRGDAQYAGFCAARRAAWPGAGLLLRRAMVDERRLSPGTPPCRACLLSGSPRRLRSPRRSCRPRRALQCRSQWPRESRHYC
jgi:hypothetical protein